MKLTDKQKIEFTDIVDDFKTRLRHLFERVDPDQNCDDFGVLLFASRELTLGEKLLEGNATDDGCIGTGFIFGDENMITNSVANRIKSRSSVKNILRNSFRIANEKIK